MDNFDERIKKQPKWVQDQIAIQHRLIEQLTESNRVLSLQHSIHATGRLSVNLGVDGEYVNLPDECTIRWFGGEGNANGITMNSPPEEDIVKCYAGFAAMVVLPRAGNAVCIAMDSLYERKKI